VDGCWHELEGRVAVPLVDNCRTPAASSAAQAASAAAQAAATKQATSAAATASSRSPPPSPPPITGGLTPVEVRRRVARIVTLGLRNLHSCHPQAGAEVLVQHGLHNTTPDPNTVALAVQNILQVQGDFAAHAVVVDCRAFHETHDVLCRADDRGHSGLHPLNVVLCAKREQNNYMCSLFSAVSVFGVCWSVNDLSARPGGSDE